MWGFRADHKSHLSTFFIPSIKRDFCSDKGYHKSFSGRIVSQKYIQIMPYYTKGKFFLIHSPPGISQRSQNIKGKKAGLSFLHYLHIECCRSRGKNTDDFVMLFFRDSTPGNSIAYFQIFLFQQRSSFVRFGCNLVCRCDPFFRSPTQFFFRSAYSRGEVFFSKPPHRDKYSGANWRPTPPPRTMPIYRR